MMSDAYNEQYNSKIEYEERYGKNSDGTEIEAEINTPFNPKFVDIITQTMVIVNIVERLRCDEIDLNPDFQRRDDLWNDQQRSRLIESLIIKIPLPTFYFDYNDSEDKLIVVDGLQRLTAIKRFVVLPPDDPKKLRLIGLEYLKDFNNKTFEELPHSIQRRIMEQSVIAYMIRPGTPEPVRTSIFTRINTGGISLTPAEIKNSVYRGKAANLLRDLARSQEFKTATGNRIPQARMLDCEFVNRFLAFYILGLENYKDNLEEYYNTVLMRIKNSSDAECEQWKSIFLSAMKMSSRIFGLNAFRKLDKRQKFSKINKPLFECISVTFARLSQTAQKDLLKEKIVFYKHYIDLLQDELFVDAITSSTAKKNSIMVRNLKLTQIIAETVGYDTIFAD